MTLYTTHCPKCTVLKKKLDQKGILYEESNDLDVLVKHGIQSVPVLDVDGELMLFDKAVEYINNL